RRYWAVAPEKDATVIVHYADADRSPALVERAVGQGRVLLFTTGFDGRRETTGRRQGDPWWSNYLESSFYPVLVNEAVGSLAGDKEQPAFNFVSGQTALVKLPPASRSALYTLQGPGLTGTEAAVPRAEDQQEVQLVQATAPGNYALLDS